MILFHNSNQSTVLKLLILLVLFLFSAFEKGTESLKILKREELKNVPSASGITKVGNSFYVVGDNSPMLFKLNNRYQIEEEIRLIPDSEPIMPKKIKEDFEAIETIVWNNQKQILVFGSGSKSPQRDVLYRYFLDNTTRFEKHNLTEFYNHLIDKTILDKKSINIEGVAVSGNQMILLNRDKNLVMVFELDDFMNYITKGGALPNPKTFQIKLPKLKEMQAEFSGAVFLPNEQKICFTASVENKDNTIDDGAIFGSYVGILDLSKLANNYEPTCILIKQNGETPKIKVESVEVLKYSKKQSATLVLVTDSDGGISEVLEAEITW